MSKYPYLIFSIFLIILWNCGTTQTEVQQDSVFLEPVEAYQTAEVILLPAYEENLAVDTPVVQQLKNTGRQNKSAAHQRAEKILQENQAMIKKAFSDQVEEYACGQVLPTFLEDIHKAILFAEGAPAGKEWGICNDRCPKTLEGQCRWAAASVVKKWLRYKEQTTNPNMEDYIDYLWNEYAPYKTDVKNDPNKLNANWGTNLRNALHKGYTL